METTHLSHTARAIVVSCMDYRLGKFLSDWTEKTLGVNTFDRLSLAGAAKNLPFVMEQIELSHRLHHIKEVYLINHEDCGAYGEAGTFENHLHDLNHAKKEILKKIPSLTVSLLYLKLDGTFVEIK